LSERKVEKLCKEKIKSGPFFFRIEAYYAVENIHSLVFVSIKLRGKFETILISE
jgi:hypothetical protein